MPFYKGHPSYWTEKTKLKVKNGLEKAHKEKDFGFKKGHIPWCKNQKGICLNTGQTHFKKGFIPWNKDTKGVMPSGENHHLYGKHRTLETIKKIREGHLGKKKSEETKRKMSLSRMGEKGSNWKGGISNENQLMRRRVEFRLWRESVFARDNWTCQKCRNQKDYLHPHHIFNFADYPELRFAIDNGITFCRDCHKKFHQKYGNKNNKEQLKEFLIL